MAQERTSISVTNDLKDELDNAKTHDGESYESLLRRLLETHRRVQSEDMSNEQVGRADAEAIASEVVRQMDYAAIGGEVAEDVRQALR